MNKSQFYILLAGYLNGNLTDTEEQRFLAMLDDDQYRLLLHDHIEDKWQNTEAFHDERLAAAITSNVLERINPKPVQTSPLITFNAWKWIAAASVIVFFMVGWYYFQNNTNETEPVNKTLADISAPRTERASLKLGNGKTIVLDSVKAGEITEQGLFQIMKLSDGSISYANAKNYAASGSIYNTLTVPRGSKVVTLTLNDGTKAWLNAESSLYFPVIFSGNSREVELSGEGFFEVSKDAARKFVVKTSNTRVEVLGTQFNVNAYPNENDVLVSLLEGKVKVRNQSSENILHPGQQAEVNRQSVTINNNIDMEAITAWKNGMFNFNNAGLPDIMQQISRWYNVEIEYAGTVRTLNFGGKISRRESVSSVLELLELTQVVKFKMEPSKKGYNGKIIVEYQ